MQLTWFDAARNMLGDRWREGSVSVSRAVARRHAHRGDATGLPQSANSDIWVVDIARGNSIKVTFRPGRNAFPVWSPDGKRLMFKYLNAGHLDLYLKNADGTGEERFDPADRAGQASETTGPRTEQFLFFQSANPKAGADIWVLQGIPMVRLARRSRFRAVLRNPSTRNSWQRCRPTGAGSLMSRPKQTMPRYLRAALQSQPDCRVGGGREVAGVEGWRGDSSFAPTKGAGALLHGHELDHDGSGGPDRPDVQPRAAPRRLFTLPLAYAGDVTSRRQAIPQRLE